MFVHGLQQVYYVEKRLMDVLGDLVDDTNNDNLTQGFSDHCDETRLRIERVFEATGHEPEEQPSRVFDTLIEAQSLSNAFRILNWAGPIILW